MEDLLTSQKKGNRERDAGRDHEQETPKVLPSMTYFLQLDLTS
jgi:hypothetical protein